jgi:translation initiation factor 5
VLCASCKNPETDLIITKDDMIVRDCKACGQRAKVDMRHKLTTFILRNPPPKPKKIKGIKKGQDVKGGDSGDGGAENGSGAGAEDAGSEDELTKTIQEGATKLPDVDPATKDDDWSVDTSKEAVAARVSTLQAGIQSTLVLDGDEDESEGPYDAFQKWTNENKDATDAAIYKHAQEMGIEKKHRTVIAAFLGLFTENAAKEIAAREALFRKVFPPFTSICHISLTLTNFFFQLVTSEKHQKSLLGGVEKLLGEIYPDALPSVPKVLMALYQIDVLDDEVVQYWGTHASKKYVDKEISKKVRRASGPFLKWLEEAEEDDEEDED